MNFRFEAIHLRRSTDMHCDRHLQPLFSARFFRFMMRNFTMSASVLVAIVMMSCLVSCAQSSLAGPQTQIVASKILALHDNGAYAWFAVPRAVLHDEMPIVGPVR